MSVPFHFTPPSDVFTNSKILKWIVRSGEPFMENQPLVEIGGERNAKIKLLAPISGYLESVKLNEGALISPKDNLAYLIECPHDLVFAGLCGQCAKDVSNLSSKTIVTGNKYITVTQKEAQRIDQENKKRLQSLRKLALVLDIDHTLVHATTEKSVKSIPKEEVDLVEFTLPPYPIKYYVKLRPGLRPFLKELHNIYELHIYTMGTRQYATKIAEIIDPENVLFKEDRILSRDDAGDMNLKNLQRIFPCDDSMVLILDDREDVWFNEELRIVSPNLIKVEPFHFFETTQELNELPKDKVQPQPIQQEVPKIDPEYLNSMKNLLVKVHNDFFDGKLSDVKKILQEVRRKVLEGCVIVFSGLIPTNVSPMSSDIWKTSENFGAKCTTEFTDSVTHVVAAKPGTDKVTRALSTPSVFLVNVDWFEALEEKWSRASEEKYSLNGLPVLLEDSIPPLPPLIEHQEVSDNNSETQSVKEEERSAKKQKVVHSESNSNGNHESTVGSDDEMISLIEGGFES